MAGWCRLSRITAYPRSRGGTLFNTEPCNPIWGLSPLARGNRSEKAGHQNGLGPIPARAGEPNSRCLESCQIGAYPRSRGGTHDARLVAGGGRGLSPLARGNHRATRSSRAAGGPIPARAGEPLLHLNIWIQVRAYPRSRGGTEDDNDEGSIVAGLSPLARGNPKSWVSHTLPSGPIPARAGEPRPLQIQ